MITEKDQMAKAKRLFFDIEVSPNVGYFWNPGHKINIGYENILKERAIICICYKWAGQKKVYGLTWDKKHCDKKLLKEFIKVANESDEMVGHNGDKFDLAWIRTRCLFHGLDMFPKYVTLDTLKVSRSKFRFNSNRLDYIAKFLGLPGKIKTEFNLWKEVMNSDKSALDYMVKYCKGDVNTLEGVYERMANHIEPKVHHGVVNDGHCYTCPECGGDHIGHIKKRITAQGYFKYQRQCLDCGKYHTTSKL